jgi:hypothetical protein
MATQNNVIIRNNECLKNELNNINEKLDLLLLNDYRDNRISYH